MNQPITTVLLLIIPNPNSTILPHSLFYKLFSQYGEVVKILIFEKSRVWKAFVEMGNKQQAQIAQGQLNGTQIVEGVTMNVYFSTLKTVTFLNNNCGGVDYRQLRQTQSDKRTSSTIRDQNLQSSFKEPVFQQFMFKSNPDIGELDRLSNQQMFHYSKLLQENLSNEDIKQLYNFKKRKSSIENRVEQSKFDYDYICSQATTRDNISQPFISIKDEDITTDQQTSETELMKIAAKEIPELLFESDDNLDENEEISPDGKKIMSAFSSNYIFSLPHLTQSQEFSTKQITNQLSSLDISEFNVVQNLSSSTEDIFDPTSYVNPQFLIENQPSKVIYIRGLAHPNIQPINIFNLLSNCGNVMVIIFIRSKSSALVQFEKIHQAQNAKDHLNNMPFFGQKLKIFYSNYQQIQFPLPYQSPQTLIYIPNKEQFRFGDGKSISFNPPSQTLHLSNIKYEVTEDEFIIRKLFENIGHVQAIKFMHLNEQKHMALVKLANLEEAMNGAALLHGKELFGRKINISFTKSKF